MTDMIETNKNTVIEAIKRNITALNSAVLLILFALFFLNIKFLFRILDYVPSFSIVAILTIMAGLVLLSLFLSKIIAKNAIKELEEYDKKLNNTLNSMQQEVTERKHVQKQLKRQVYFDQLTELPNRALFQKRLNRILERSKKHKNYLFAVLFMDLDDFKIINDSLGHIIGDQLLVSVARSLETCVRSVDTVARFGGDEFAILLDNISNVSDATRIADRVQKKLKLPLNLSGHYVVSSVSIGIALNTKDYDREKDLLRDADTAMYHSKEKGKSRYEIFDTEMHNSVMKRLKLEAELRQAVEREEFIIYYQPIVSVINGRIVGVEALVRWQHPQYGLIPPNEFISVAEDTGLIALIGKWVLRTACAQNKVWNDAGYEQLRIDVNFSAYQFHQQNITKLIKEVLQETDMNPQLLDIEITESIAMEDNSIGILNELSEMGVRTSIDDFGTGHSSLGSLKRFPINELKIDKSFIKDIAVDPDTEAIVRAIIAMAHTLKIKVIAEGVETEEQLVFLQSNLCEEAQGYLFSPPVPEEEFTKLLREKHFSSTLTLNKYVNKGV
jgi:diguanylate cyclase (GGDEF)-like protein